MRSMALIGLEGARYSSLAALIDLCALGNGYTSRLYEPVAEPTQAMGVRLLTPGGGDLVLADGRRMSSDGDLSSDEIHDVVLLSAFDPSQAGGLDLRLARAGPLIDWLKRQKAAGARIGGGGAAVFILAQAGLLAEATAPWLMEREFRRRWPRIALDPSRPVVESDGVFTANGIGAEPILALRLIETVVSPNLADVLSKHTGIDSHPDEPVGDAVFSTSMMREDPLVGRAQLWLQQRFSQRSDMAELAATLAVSQRTLSRRFRQRTGMTPQAYLQHLRIEAAKNMLAKSGRRIERIAAMVGYADPAFFKRLFRERVGVSPSEFRRQTRPVSPRR